MENQSSDLLDAINTLAVTSESGDKELSVLQVALSAAFNHLTSNEKALTDIANAVKNELGKDLEHESYVDCKAEIETLTSSC